MGRVKLTLFCLLPTPTYPAPIHNESERASKPVADTSNMRWSLKRMTWPDPRVGGERREVRVICQVRCPFLTCPLVWLFNGVSGR